MARLTLLSCLLSVGTTLLVVGLALPEWFHQRYKDYHAESYISGGTWRACFARKQTDNDIYETCVYRVNGYKDDSELLRYVAAITGLMAGSLLCSLLALLTDMSWVVKARRLVHHGYTVSHRTPAACFTAIFALISGLSAIGLCVIFWRSLEKFTDVEDTALMAPYWLTVGGACCQIVMAVLSFILIAASRSSQSYGPKTTDVIVY